MRVRYIALAIVLLAAPLTGCLGMGDEESTGDEGLDTKSKATVTSQDGGIEGLVTDSAVQPVTGATVELNELGEETTTTDDGSFAFSEIPPGPYTLSLRKDGFISTERTVDVSAGQVSTVEILLPHAPTVTPYMEQFEFTGFMECSVGAGLVLYIISSNPCSNGPLGSATNTKTSFNHEIQPNAWQVVTEVSRDGGTPASDRYWLTSEVDGFNSAWKVAYDNERGTTPIISHNDRADLAGISANFTAICKGEEDPEETSNQAPDAYCNHDPIEKGAQVNIEVYVQTASASPAEFVGAGAAIQESLQVYRTIFYNAPACEDFSILEDNQCEQLPAPPEEDPYEELTGSNATPSNGSGSR